MADRACFLGTAELLRLDQECEMIDRAFGGPPYLVGSAGERSDYRDVDVRLILKDDEFDALFVVGGRKKWELLSLALGDYLRIRTGLPIDFQIQRQTEANEHFDGPRNPLGMGRTLAGGGDATPWTIRRTAAPKEKQDGPRE